MFRTPIILVDDEKDQLDKLNMAFALSGLPCLPILYTSENETGIDRIIALDINLRGEQDPTDAKRLYSPIEKVLEKLKPTGPYYLLFWSRYKDLPEQIIILLSTRSKDVVPAPIGWGFLDKTDFQDPGSSDELKRKLLEVVSEVKIFNLLLEWEGRTRRAASYTLSELYKIAATPHDNGWKIEETRKRLITLITHIAHEAVGNKNSKTAPNHAVETGLLPILEDNLLDMTSADSVGRLNDEWASCLSKLGNPAGLESLSEEDTSRLNSFYNLEELPDTYSKCKRGVFVNSAYTDLTDHQKFLKTFGAHTEGFGLSDLVREEFVFKANTDERNAVISASMYGWLEIGAACDHAQLKNKLHRYLFGMLIPAEFQSYLYDGSRNLKDRAHAGIYRSPILRYREKPYILFLSFRYQIGVHPGSDLLGVSLFRMKDHIMNEITFNWSKYSIRPGITSFRQ